VLSFSVVVLPGAIFRRNLRERTLRKGEGGKISNTMELGAQMTHSTGRKTAETERPEVKPSSRTNFFQSVVSHLAY
jgi:hypothetical protein